MHQNMLLIVTPVDKKASCIANIHNKYAAGVNISRHLLPIGASLEEKRLLSNGLQLTVLSINNRPKLAS